MIIEFYLRVLYFHVFHCYFTFLFFMSVERHFSFSVLYLWYLFFFNFFFQFCVVSCSLHLRYIVQEAYLFSILGSNSWKNWNSTWSERKVSAEVSASAATRAQYPSWHAFSCRWKSQAVFCSAAKSSFAAGTFVAP